MTTTKKQIKGALITLFENLAEDLSQDLAEAPEFKKTLEAISIDGARLVFRCMVAPPGDIPEVEKMADLFDAIEDEYIDLVMPAEIRGGVIKPTGDFDITSSPSVN